MFDLDPAHAHSFRVQGPTILIEYEAIDEGSGPNHIHAMWRDPERDYGADLLAAHYAAEHEQER